MVPAEYSDNNQLPESQIEKDNSSPAYEAIQAQIKAATSSDKQDEIDDPSGLVATGIEMATT